MSLDEIREVLARAAKSPLDNLTLSNYWVRGNSFENGTLTQADFDAETTKGVIGDVLSHASRVSDGAFVHYDPAYQTAHNEFLVDGLANSPFLAALVQEASDDDNPLDTSSHEPIQAMFHCVRDHRGLMITAVRLKGQGIYTRRARGVRALIARDGIYVPIDEEIVYYEPRFDALIIENQVIVSVPSTIQQQFGSAARARNLARETINRLAGKVAIDGIDALRDAATTQPAMVAKMASISRLLDSDPEYAALVTTDNLVGFVAAHPEVEIEISGVGTRRALVFDPRPQNRFAILKLVADDFLQSGLSGRNYEAGSKQRLK